MSSNESGKKNTAIGTNSLSSNTNGNNNTIIGYNSGTILTTGSNNIIIGFNAQPSVNSVNYEITLGDNSITALRCNTQTITSLSDIRDKTDIQELEPCLHIIEKLNPVTFKWDKREWYDNGIPDKSKKDDKVNIGFIAQDLKKIQDENNINYFNLIYENNPSKIEATPGNLLIPLIKAVQELSEKVKILENKLK